MKLLPTMKMNLLFLILLMSIFPTEKGISFSNLSQEENKLIIKSKDFKDRLVNGKSIKSLMSTKWTLVYHEDNRCDGSTDGSIKDLTNNQIDEVIKFEVKNDGNGWACDKKNPKTYFINFSLRQQLEKWDNYEATDYNKESDVIYLVDQGNSVYLKLHFDKNGLIKTIEYRNEDPG